MLLPAADTVVINVEVTLLKLAVVDTNVVLGATDAVVTAVLFLAVVGAAWLVVVVFSDVVVVGYGTMLAVVVPFAVELIQTREPTWTVFVERRLGWVLVNGAPAAPVPFAKR